MRFRKKPVVIDAVLWNGSNFEPGKPDWLYFPVTEDGELFREGDAMFCAGVDAAGKPIVSVIVRTLEGDMQARPGDWIIRGIKDEVYPCKPDIFEATYEKVES